MLRLEEVFAFVRQGALPGEEFATLVDRRRNEQSAFACLPAYTRLVFAEKPFDRIVKHAVPMPKKGMGALAGTPCSYGVAAGPVLVVSDPYEVGDVSGKILVTKMTDPGWVFLLATAAGLIAEKGSLLSHTAIISRELGVPMVVGVSGATTALRTGDVVRLDADRGEIEVVEHA